LKTKMAQSRNVIIVKNRQNFFNFYMLEFEWALSLFPRSKI